MGGGGARGFKAVATCGATHPSIDAGCEASVGAWEEHGGGRPLLFGDGVKIGGRGGAEKHRAQGASCLDQLHQFGVAGEKPLGTEGNRESRFEGKRGAGGIEAEDGGT